ncbi:MAG: DUF2125 domain-containing protein [Pseudomonadota bacterium]
MKKTLILLFIVVAFGAAWSTGWYFVAGQVEQALAIAKTRLQSQDKLLQCPNEEIGGFPFRISVTCDEMSYFDNQKGFFLEAGALRSAAQAYQPGKAVVELDGPAVLTVAHSETFDVQWKSLRASLFAGLGGVEKFSTVGRELSLVSTRLDRDAVTLEELQLHGRKSGENDVDLAMSSGKVVSTKRLWPDFDLAVNVRFEKIYDQLSRRPDLIRIARNQGLEGQLTGLDYHSLEGGKVSVAGPMKIDTRGLLSGNFNISASELNALVRSLGRAFPDRQEMFEQAETAAALLSSASKDGKVQVPVTVSNGQAKIGLIPIGTIPPLF